MKKSAPKNPLTLILLVSIISALLVCVKDVGNIALAVDSCTIAEPAPATFIFDSIGGDESTSVVATSGACSQWYIQNDNDWIVSKVTDAGSTGMNLSFTVLPNPSKDKRTGTVTVRDKVFTIIQNCREGVYTYVLKWGSFGHNDSQFWHPSSVAVGPTGDVYVTDTYNDRIQKFTANGAFIAKWGASGSADGQFDTPTSVGTDSDGNVYVADTYNNRIQKFDKDGGFITKWGSRGSGESQFYYATGLAVDPAGFVYVADSNNARVQKFKLDGTFVDQWGEEGSADGQFDHPVAVAVDKDGNVFVNDYYNYRFQKFDSAGNFITKWGSHGSGDGQFDEPIGVATDIYGNVYIADYYNHRIQKFSPDGVFIAKWGSFGTSNGKFNAPRGVAVNPEGYVYVAERDGFRVQKFIACGSGACRYSLSPSSAGFTSSAGSGAVNITASAEDCAWTSQANNNWIALEGETSGAGSGMLSFTVFSNEASKNPRTGSITAAGQTYTINQDGKPCSYAIDPGDRTISKDAATGLTVAVDSTPDNCTWTSTENTPWITITGGATGTGDRNVTYSVSENTEITERTALLSIAGKPHTLNQNGIPCNYTLSPPNITGLDANEHAGLTVTLLASDQRCQWTAISGEAWVSITDGASGTGDGVITYTVSASTSGSQRSTSIKAKDQTHLITQNGCAYSIDPASRSVRQAAGQYSFTVTTESACPWSAAVTSGGAFISIDSGYESGTGSGPVVYTVEENDTGAQRNGVITLNNSIDHDIAQYVEGRKMAIKSYYISSNGWLINAYTEGAAGSFSVYLVVKRPDNTIVPFDQIPAFMSAGNICHTNPCLVEDAGLSPDSSLVYDYENGKAYIHHDREGSGVVTEVEIVSP